MKKIIFIPIIVFKNPCITSLKTATSSYSSNRNPNNIHFASD